MRLRYLLAAMAAVALLTGCKNDEGVSSQTPSSALVSTNGTNNLSLTQTNNARLNATNNLSLTQTNNAVLKRTNDLLLTQTNSAVLNETNGLVLSQTNASASPITAIAADQATTNALSPSLTSSTNETAINR